MDYELAIEETPETIPGGTGILLLHPSIGETDRIDTDFFKVDTDHFLVISTRTTAREVEQKLEYYEVDESRATILDTLSIERGYSRRSADNIYYVASPDDLDAIVEKTRQFLERHDGKLRLSIDSVTEMAYYADVDRAFEATKQILELLEEYDAVGLFHLSKEVHNEETLQRFRELFDGVVDLDEDGTVSTEF
ncbi:MULTISPECIES: hypothetical protein [Haloferax]|uniref:ATPase involved in flagella biogenesis n=2 Tax=Haloferax TaxID=2251 RepID=A0A6G1YZD7_9EURY|nr:MULTISPECIES: hypothetical protein [Haloferax]KAB1187130.1 hypothetical protein Hfx1149_03410 [Haloferax sp. CBA1149]MRW79767.1 hypothetical protein [Haloferax marinisediminis]